MEQHLAKLKAALTTANLLEPDWPIVVQNIEEFGKKKELSGLDAVEAFYGEPMNDVLVSKLVESEKRRVKIRDVARRLLVIDDIVVKFFKGSAFFTEVSRWIRKTRATTWKGVPIHTAAMCYNTEHDDFEMVWNPNFFARLLVDAGEDLGVQHVQGVYCHELWHFILKHCTVRRAEPHSVSALSTDLANNSLCIEGGMKLPDGCLFPGTPWNVPPAVATLRNGIGNWDIPPAEVEMRKSLGRLIGTFPPMMTTEWYHARILEWAQENKYTPGKNGFKIPGQGGGEVSLGGEDLDVHELWDELPQDARERISEKMKQILKNATQVADGNSKGWGTISASMQKEIRAFVNNTINWETLLQQFFGSFTRGPRVKSMKRINKKYPYIHAGHRREHLPKMLIALDYSGSVNDEYVAMMWGVIANLSKLIDFTVICFDTDVDENNIVKWRRGAPIPKMIRSKRGGTDFNAPVRWADHPSRRGSFDGMVILTDGECSEPVQTRLKKAYIIVPGHQLMFKTKDTVINMIDSGNKRKGVIR